MAGIRAVFLSVVAWLLVACEPAAAEASAVDFVRDIKPLLLRSCVGCHGPEKQRSGLRLDTGADLLKGGNSGAVIVPGKSSASRLIQAVTGANDVPPMPPKGERLTVSEIARLRAWIDSGAKAPVGELAETTITKSNHWAFQPPLRPEEPLVQNLSWARNPIDLFILAQQEKKRIAPSPEADRVTLIRRLSLDLLGLPPSPQELERFLADVRPDAYERLVDRLLASPHYGERWARDWLDLARYADSNGFNIDSARSAWPYRDWVIHALNQDMPFDQFAIEQLAGDLLPNATVSQKVATGFHRNTQINQEGGIDKEQFRVESIIDRVNTTGAVFLGLTVGCAQCHGHKFDPISQREYYQLFAFLNNSEEPTLELATGEQTRQREQALSEVAAVERVLKLLDTTSPERIEQWENNLTTDLRKLLPQRVQTVLEVMSGGRSLEQQQILMEAYQKADEARHLTGLLGTGNPLAAAAYMHTAVARADLQGRLTKLKERVPTVTTALVMEERTAPRPTNVLIGGEFTRRGVEVMPGAPAILHPLKLNGGSPLPTRLDLARWVVDPANPLTARVTVNRVWQHYFGLGLVETENDFGTQGTPPSHPELLDWLANEFVSPSPQSLVPSEGGTRGWSLKTLHRLIVTSATYRQSSKVRPELATIDARNQLLARQNRLRLEAEFVRDVTLAASGLLNPTIGGPSVFPPQPEGLYRFTQFDKHWKVSMGPERYRRGMYTHFWRSAPHPALTVFDAPDASATCTRRNRSNTPLQALTLLNDQGFYEFAQGLASRVLKEASGSEEQRLDYAFRLGLGRQPDPMELKSLRQLLARQQTEFEADPQSARAMLPDDVEPPPNIKQLTAWTTVARVLLNLDEFITRE